MDNKTHTKTMSGNKYRLSVIIPNHNGAETIGLCLEALLASGHDSYEIIVIDDCSSDNSVEIISRYPCSLIRLEQHSGAAAARNAGVQNSKGEILFFTDADCLVLPDTLEIAERSVNQHETQTIIGGTYTRKPFDKGFFSVFQSVFINYSELKDPEHPDYIATHAMAMKASIFKSSGGFSEKLSILEDVEFSHRMKRQGFNLLMEPDLLVKHVFNFSLLSSMRNGFRKSRFWTRYSMENGDLLTDSGTASFELKSSVALFHITLLYLVSLMMFPGAIPAAAIFVLVFINVLISHRMLGHYYASGGAILTIKAAGYLMLIYPLAVSAGTLSGMIFRYRSSSGSS